MDRNQVVLAALAAGGQNASYTPVQVQKLFFLLDREASHLLEGPHFNFMAYDYGPFDQAVYSQIEELAARGLADVQNSGRYRRYALTSSGYTDGSAILVRLNAETRQYVSEVAQWVRQLSFEQLVASIYKRYPEMKANSVFRG